MDNPDKLSPEEQFNKMWNERHVELEEQLTQLIQDRAREYSLVLRKDHVYQIVHSALKDAAADWNMNGQKFLQTSHVPLNQPECNCGRKAAGEHTFNCPLNPGNL